MEKKREEEKKYECNKQKKERKIYLFVYSFFLFFFFLWGIQSIAWENYAIQLSLKKIGVRKVMRRRKRSGKEKAEGRRKRRVDKINWRRKKERKKEKVKEKYFEKKKKLWRAEEIVRKVKINKLVRLSGEGRLGKMLQDRKKKKEKTKIS